MPINDDLYDQDLYGRLLITSSASAVAIKFAYRSLARAVHPGMGMMRDY